MKLTRLMTILGMTIAAHQIALAGPDDKAIVVAKPQTSVLVTLPANATTGYQWYVKHYDHDLLELKSYQYQAPNTAKVGAPGTAVFTFTALPNFLAAPQITDIDLVYARAWDIKDNAKAQTVTVVSVPVLK